MKKMRCVICGREGRSLDEHIESHHNRYDVHRILVAILEILEQVGNSKALHILKNAQRDNAHRLQKRAKSMVGVDNGVRTP
jgi:hypothetical protein